MKTSFIPAKDALFALWLANLSVLLTADPTAYGVTAGEALTLHNANIAFDSAFTLASDPITRTPATVSAKNTARYDATVIARTLCAQIQMDAGVTDEQRTQLGLTVRNVIPTPIPAPTTFPQVSFVAATPLTHLLNYRDSETPNSKSKPYGVIGLELVASVGTVAATDPAQCKSVGTFTKSPLRVGFASEDAGKTVTYFARWITKSGPAGKAQVGPWSSRSTSIVVA